MKLLDRQVLLELLGPFLFGVAAFTSVFFAGTYLLKLTTWIMNGMPILTALQIVLLYLPSIVVYTLPMSTLLAVLLGMGRLSGDSEITALFAGGVSLYRVTAPVVVLGIAVSATSIALNEVVAPRANTRNQVLQAAVFKQASITDRPFTVMDETTGSLIRVNGGMDVDSGVLREVTIVQYLPQLLETGAERRKERVPRMLWYAARAQWEGVRDEKARYRWKLFDGSWWLLSDTRSSASGTFRELSTREIVIMKTPDELSLYQKDPEQMSFAELSQMVKYLRTHPDRPLEKIRELEVDRWNKIALPISSLVFAMLAAPMGIRPHRSSSSVGLGLSILLILVYWMIWHYTSSLAHQGSLAPEVGAFAANVLGIAAAIVLLKRAAK